MARRTEYDASQAAKRLRVPAAAFRWTRHAGLIPAPDVSFWQWSRAAVEALDAAIRAALPGQPISGGAAADPIAEALGTPNVIGETSFVVRRFIDRLTELSANPDGSMLDHGQVTEVSQREDLAELVAADARIGPDQAAMRLSVRRTEFDHMVRLGWIKPADSIEVGLGISRGGTVEVALYRVADVDALPTTRIEVDWEQLRVVQKGRRSPLAALQPTPA
ncbi:hypothetical protein AB0D12_41095 [Streptomyces sp. NPDC048479]|uniref:hypothetical protein n=1 Tax=Streptomyces sp. NPDC048479 TaxID=3154725 RepID=UPI003421DB01